MASNLTVRDRRSYPLPGVGELTALLPSWRLHPEASNLSPRTVRACTVRAYTDDGALLATTGMLTAVLST
jgi:hypothetical protein